MSTPEWAPSANAVGNIIARLVPDAAGFTPGTFSDQTIPTLRQVNDTVDSIAVEVDLVTPDLTVELQQFAGRVVALGTAAQMAAAYFPELGQTFIDRLQARYEEALQRLIGAAERGVDGGLTAVGDFPPALPPVEEGGYYFDHTTQTYRPGWRSPWT